MGSVSSANSGCFKPSDAFNVDELLSLIAFATAPPVNGALQVSQSPDLVILPSFRPGLS